MNFPVKLSFKKIALAPQISVIDADGRLQLYVRQKLMKLREAITVYADQGQSQPLYQIKADRIIDFSARYHFRDQNGRELGSVKRQGARSIWRAHYNIADENGREMAEIHEESVMTRVLDGFFGDLPIIGFLSGYLFNPTYLVTDRSGNLLMRIKKEPSLFESSFVIYEETPLSNEDELQLLLGILMMTLLERTRG
ncbi:MAG: LURP-one-related family protein [Chloroflexota bacterium]